MSWDLAIFAWVILMIVSVIVFFGVRYVAQVELVMLGLVYMSITAICIGVLIPPRTNENQFCWWPFSLPPHHIILCLSW